MSWGRPSRGIVVPVATIAAVTAFVVQYLTGTPIAGVAGIAALLVPGFVVSSGLLGPKRSRLEAALVTVAGGLAVTVLVSVAAAFTPRGLDAGTIAVFEYVTLAGLFLAWLFAAPRSGPAPARRVRPVTLPSLVLVLTGVGLGSLAMVVAGGAARTQEYAGYLQLWSGPSPDTSQRVVGVGNTTGALLECELEVTRGLLSPVQYSIPDLADGESWLAALPDPATGDDREWLIQLDCTSDDGVTFERRLHVDPPVAA